MAKEKAKARLRTDNGRFMKEPGKDHFTSLPVELLVQVAKQLPATQIALLRGQSRRMKQVIDANEDALTRDTIAKHTLRLQSHVDLLTIQLGLDINQLVVRYIEYYGIDSFQWSYDNEHPLSLNGCLIDRYCSVYRPVNVGRIRRYIRKVIDLYKRMDFTPAFHPSGSELLEEFRKVTLNYNLGCGALQNITSDFLAVLSAPKVLTETSHKGHDSVGYGYNDFLRYATYQRVAWKGTEGGEKAVFPHLLLPELGTSRTLWYYVDKSSLAQLAEEASSNEETLSVIQQAALIESMYVW